GQPLLVNGDVAETGLPLRNHEERQRATHSAMCWPLRVSERTIGAVAVNRAVNSPRYTVEDLEQGQALTSLLALVMANHRMHVERDSRILELSTLNATMQRINAMLEDAQNQVIQSEKLASIGQISAGVAHEINNPLAFVLSNSCAATSAPSFRNRAMACCASSGSCTTCAISRVAARKRSGRPSICMPR